MINSISINLFNFNITLRFLETHSKQFCLWILTKRIYIICIIGKAYAIQFFVAIVLPRKSFQRFDTH